MSLRDDKRAQTRQALTEEALALFAERGFDGTSVDAITEAAGVSRRTFFRYFDTKEAVFFANQRRRFDEFAALLAAPHPRESRWETVRRAMLAFAARYEEERETLLAERAIITASRSLVVAELEVDLVWERAIAAYLCAGKNTSPRARRRAEVIAGSAVGMTRAVLRSWYASNGRLDLIEVAHEALQTLEGGLAEQEAG